ncbi:MAG: radical SAM protein [Methanomassiliicoccales archaeon]
MVEVKVRSIEAGSAYTRSLPKGCQICRRGAKMVLLVTGKCETGCYYCPLSKEKKGKEVVYADELKVHSDEDVIMEAKSIKAGGTGITGGDPLKSLQKVLHYVGILRETFGEKHHIHLYTASIDDDAYKILQGVGLNELRIHPPTSMWTKMNRTGLEKAISGLDMSVGIEVPAIPGHEKQLEALIRYADAIGLDFVNLNELEFSETNFKQLSERGFAVKDEISSAAWGSEETALKMLRLEVGIPVHYCSSAFKDSVQLRRRLMRRAKNVAKRGDVITEDGTLVKGVVEPDEARLAKKVLSEDYDVPDTLMYTDPITGRLEVAPWILKELEGLLPFDSYIVEEYPTADRLEVERELIKGKMQKDKAKKCSSK